jgi:hypothetical protein
VPLLCLRCRISHALEAWLRAIHRTNQERYGLELLAMASYALDDEGKLTIAAVVAPPAKPVEVSPGIELMDTPMHPIGARPLSAASHLAAEQADKDSEHLWMLKSTWRKTTKKDRSAFIEWTKQN